MEDNLENIDNINSQQKCIIIIDNKEYKGNFIKLNQNYNLFYLLIREEIKKSKIIYNKKIDIILYNNKKKEINLNNRIIEDLNINNKNLSCIEIMKDDNIDENYFYNINKEKNYLFDIIFKKIESKRLNSETKNGQNSKCEYLTPQMEFNSINETEKNEKELSYIYLENNDTKIDNCFNKNYLKFWLFIIILNIFLIIIIVIICLNLKKYEEKYEDKNENKNKMDVNQ